MSDHAQDDDDDDDTPLAPGTIIQDPRDCDVLGTKSRKVHQSHPGTLFYWNLIQNATIPPERGPMWKTVAGRIYDIVTVDRKGTFLRKDPDSNGWVVLDKKQSLTKIINSLNYLDTKRQDPDRLRSPKRRQQGGDDASSSSSPCRRRSPQRKRVKTPQRAKRRRHGNYYVVKAGKDTAMLPYAQELIGAVCNELDPETAVRRLEKGSKEETLQERNFRLQLRQRYVAALRQGQSLTDFSRKLLAGWGATLEMDVPQSEHGETDGEGKRNASEEGVASAETEKPSMSMGAADHASMEETPKIKNGQNRFEGLLEAGAKDDGAVVEATVSVQPRTEKHDDVVVSMTDAVGGQEVVEEQTNRSEPPNPPSPPPPVKTASNGGHLDLDFDFTKAQQPPAPSRRRRRKPKQPTPAREKRRSGRLSSDASSALLSGLP